jgi:hypothetical protein
MALALAACSSSSSNDTGDAGGEGGDDGGADVASEAAHEAGPPSPFAGTWQCVVTTELDYTVPITQKTTGNANVTYVVVDNGDGTVTASSGDKDAGSLCVLKYSVAGTTATLAPGQSCQAVASGSNLTFTYQTGTATLGTDAAGGVTSTGALTYAFSGTEQQTSLDGGTKNITVGGTGKDGSACTKQ